MTKFVKVSMIDKPIALDQEISDIPLADLKLDESITNLLVTNGTVTVGDVYTLEAEGIALSLNIDYESAERFWRSTLDFVSKPSEWAKTSYIAKEPAIRINLSEVLPNWIKEFFVSSKRDRDHQILVRRYGLDGKESSTLEDVGIYLELTRERVRQLQDKALERLFSSLFGQVLFPSEVTQELIQLRNLIEDGVPQKSEVEIFEIITKRYGKKLTSSLEQHYRLIFELFGWERLADKSHSVYLLRPLWILDKTRLSPSRVFEAGQKLVKLLQEKCDKLEYFEIKVALNSKRQNRYSDLEIRTALNAASDIEQLEGDTFQLSFQRLKSASDMAFRVLKEHGAPLSSAEIHREISRRLVILKEKPLNRRTISGQFAGDPRFVPIGKKQWALTDWEDITLGTIVEHMKNFFYQHGKSATAGEIYEYVRSKRVVNRNSISAYLHSRDEFIRVSKGLYQLSEWGTSKEVNSEDGNERWTRDMFAKRIVEIFDQGKTEVMTVAELIQQLGLAGNTNNVYLRLRNCPAVKIQVVSERPRRLEAIVVRNYSFQKTITLRDRVQETVREILLKRPDNSMPLSDLRSLVCKRIDVLRYTFYGYLSEMVDIQKNVIGDTKAVIVTLVNTGSDGLGDDVSDKWDSKFSYDIAISYAGQQRAIASELADSLRREKLKVFYDRHQLPDIIGRNLLDELLVIYRDKAKLCVVLASEEYNISPYAQHERQSAQERALNDPGYIVLVNLDGCKIKGFHSTVAYLDWNEHKVSGISTVAIKQLRQRYK
jgi:hypothetical protein